MVDTIDVDIRHPLAVVTFRNPPHNHVNVAVLRGLADTLEQLDAEAAVRAIVVKSEGKTFCAGADLVSAEGFGASGDDPLREFYDQAIRLFATGKPIVAMIQGAAIGAGLGLALAADFRIAGPKARFSANFVKLGFHPGFGLTQTLPRVIGHQRAAEMFLTGARFKPEQVSDWGLVDRVSDADTLWETTLAFAESIAENAPLSLVATRATLRGDLLATVRAALNHEHAEQIKLQRTRDFAEGVAAVAQRRPGQFEGR